MLTEPYKEIATKKELDEVGVKSFLPLRDVELSWGGKVIRKKNVILPRIIFVYTTYQCLGELTPQFGLTVMQPVEKISCSACDVDNLQLFFSIPDIVCIWDWDMEVGSENEEYVTLSDGKLKGLRGYIQTDNKDQLRIPVGCLGSLIISLKE